MALDVPLRVVKGGAYVPRQRSPTERSEARRHIPSGPALAARACQRRACQGKPRDALYGGLVGTGVELQERGRGERWIGDDAEVWLDEDAARRLSQLVVRPPGSAQRGARWSTRVALVARIDLYQTHPRQRPQEGRTHDGRVLHVVRLRLRMRGMHGMCGMCSSWASPARRDARDGGLWGNHCQVTRGALTQKLDQAAATKRESGPPRPLVPALPRLAL